MFSWYLYKSANNGAIKASGYTALSLSFSEECCSHSPFNIGMSYFQCVMSRDIHLSVRLVSSSESSKKKESSFECLQGFRDIQSFTYVCPSQNFWYSFTIQIWTLLWHYMVSGYEFHFLALLDLNSTAQLFFV